MNNPAIVSCPENAWTKVATNVTAARIHILDDTPPVYCHTYRLTGQAAPSDDSEAVEFENELSFSASAACDVYVLPRGVAGSVRVDA